MITKFEKYNEGIRHLLVGPTKEEVWIELMNGKLKGLIKTIPESPIDFFYQIKDGCEISKNGNPFILWTKNKQNVFKQYIKSNYFYVDYQKIWLVFEDIFGIEYNDIYKLINSILENDEDFKGCSFDGWDDLKN